MKQIKLSINSFIAMTLMTVFNMSASQAKDHTIYQNVISGAQINQTFPSAAGSTPEASWSFNWLIPEGKGLEIQDVFFQTSPTSTAKQVLFEASANEILTISNDGNSRSLISANSPAYTMHTLTAAECPYGTLLPEGTEPKVVCMQVKDRGLAWRSDRQGTDGRRGEEMVLWSILDTDNNSYVYEWTFRDDGVMESRIGVTGQHTTLSPGDAQNHNVFWRLDFDMDGEANDSVLTSSHIESTKKLHANDVEDQVLTESGVVWDPYLFTTLIIRDAFQTNSHGITSSYYIIPNKAGLGRHQEAYTHNDFWVLSHSANELDVTALPSYLSNDSVDNTDVVVWYMDTLHHVTRAEDGEYDVSGNFSSVATEIEWVGVTIKPHDVFDQSPLTQ